MKPDKFAIAAAIAATMTIGSCTTEKSNGFIGSAIVEANTYQVATTAQGSLVAVNTDEGAKVAQGELMAIIDTIPLLLKRDEINGSISELTATISAKQSELKAMSIDLAGLERNYNRVALLADSGSAPLQQRDDLKTTFESAQNKYQGNKSMLNALEERQLTLKSSIALCNDQIRRCYIYAPHSGVVLSRYRNLGEVATPASPLFEIGTNDTVFVDFFVVQPAMSELKLGQIVKIRMDTDLPSDKSQSQFFNGAITWISDEAEFSPKNIQTREARNELVFRVRATVPNTNGGLKRGLPVEIYQNTDSSR